MGEATREARLSPDDLAAFTRWFEEFVADAWDRQIETDILAGRLDKAGQKADEDFEAGRCRYEPLRDAGQTEVSGHQLY